jgi:hypothetical protein
MVKKPIITSMADKTPIALFVRWLFMKRTGAVHEKFS